ncbi:UPF0764 protein C16orf89 [Plecturocebus cupreus]
MASLSTERRPSLAICNSIQPSPKSHSVTQAGGQWHNLGSLQPLPPRVKEFSASGSQVAGMTGTHYYKQYGGNRPRDSIICHQGIMGATIQDEMWVGTQQNPIRSSEGFGSHPNVFGQLRNAIMEVYRMCSMTAHPVLVIQKVRCDLSYQYNRHKEHSIPCKREMGWAQQLTPVISALWETKAGESLEPRGSVDARAGCKTTRQADLLVVILSQHFIYTHQFSMLSFTHPRIKRFFSQVQWFMPVIPALGEAEAGGSLEIRSSRPAWPTCVERMNEPGAVAHACNPCTSGGRGRWIMSNPPASASRVAETTGMHRQAQLIFFLETESLSVAQTGVQWLLRSLQPQPRRFEQFSHLTLLSSKDYRYEPPSQVNFFVFSVETGFHHVDQAGLKLLTSSDPPTSDSQNAGITGKSSYYVAQAGLKLWAEVTLPPQPLKHWDDKHEPPYPTSSYVEAIPSSVAALADRASKGVVDVTGVIRRYWKEKKKKRETGQVQWLTPIIPALWETEWVAGASSAAAVIMKQAGSQEPGLTARPHSGVKGQDGHSVSRASVASGGQVNGRPRDPFPANYAKRHLVSFFLLQLVIRGACDSIQDPRILPLIQNSSQSPLPPENSHQQWLECSGIIMVHSSLQLLASRDPLALASQRQCLTVSLAGLEPLASSHPHTLASQSARITGMSHCI